MGIQVASKSFVRDCVGNYFVLIKAWVLTKSLALDFAK